MTVRLPESLDQWVREYAEGRPGGQSGVAEDALQQFRERVEDKTEALHKAITGEP